MLEVTVHLSVSWVSTALGPRPSYQTAHGTQRMKVITVPRLGEKLVIEYSYTNEKGDTVEDTLTPLIKEISHVFPRNGDQIEIILDCGVAALTRDLVMFEKAVEKWRRAGFEVAIKETKEEDF